MAFCTKLLHRTLMTSAPKHAIKQITIIGGGQMGAGIAQVAAQTGHTVSLVDLDDNLLKKSVTGIEKNLTRVAKKKFADQPQDGQSFVKDAISKISVSTDAIESSQSADLVIEAIIEKLDIKQKLFSDLDKAVPSNVIFASNTSSFQIGDIASDTQRKDRFGGLHFFNPVPVMKLVEVVSTKETSDATFQELFSFGQAMGKTCVKAKDVPGFIVNRLLVPYLVEAAKMVERGDATPEDIDVAMKLGAGYPMGPIQLVDYVGLDTCTFVYEGWGKIFPNNPMFEQSEVMLKLVSEGKVGIKVKEGFYKYDK